jgi:hypothetical protein
MKIRDMANPEDRAKFDQQIEKLGKTNMLESFSAYNQQRVFMGTN